MDNLKLSRTGAERTWERSYYDNTLRETVERIDTFNILSELHLARRLRPR